MMEGNSVANEEEEDIVLDGKGRLHRFREGAEGILANLRCGIRAAFFLRVEPDRLIASPWAFALLGLFDLILHLALSFARIGPTGHVTGYELPNAAIHIPLMLFAGLWVGHAARRDGLALPLATIYLAAGIPISLLAELVNSCLENGWLPSGGRSLDFDHFYPLFYWWVLAVLVVTLRMTGVKRMRRMGVASLLSVVLVLPLWAIDRGELWNSVYEDGTSSYEERAGNEEVIYRQPLLMESALERLRRGRKGVEDLYFVGFAGYGSQDVFRKEIEVIGRLFQARFDTAGRSLLLVNSQDTLLKYPIATATSLERALKRVGEVMDRDEDVLVLYLTSHGSEDHTLSAELRPLTLRDIEPAMLRRMLDDAGIRWRVVIVSACYSGGFIEPLRDDGTLIVTASDASNNSFGCSNDSDFTWFGKAFFDEELRRTHSFTTAFTRAAASICAREEREGENPSHPQISMGKVIRPRLRRIEERLDRLEREQRTPRGRDAVAMKPGN
jgi:hypothetical protein